MTNLFKRIEEVIQPLPGWCDLVKAQTLASMVIALRPTVTLEVGIYGGKSFLPLALAHREIGKGIVWGIDPWTKDAAITNETKENADWWSGQDYGKLHGDFMAKLNELSLHTVCKIFRAKSDDVEPPQVIDILHLDGNHQIQAVKDAERFGSKVRTGGLIICDDESWVGGNVKASIEKLKGMGFTELFRLGTGLVMQRL